MKEAERTPSLAVGGSGNVVELENETIGTQLGGVYGASSHLPQPTRGHVQGVPSMRWGAQRFFLQRKGGGCRSDAVRALVPYSYPFSRDCCRLVPESILIQEIAARQSAALFLLQIALLA